MREIKFRQFINGEFWYWGCGVLLNPNEFVHPLDPSKQSDQYTGLKDSRGIKIYERDIVAPSDNSKQEENRQVRFIDGCFCYSLSSHVSTKGQYSQLSRARANMFKVIGNLDETPELLK